MNDIIIMDDSDNSTSSNEQKKLKKSSKFHQMSKEKANEIIDDICLGNTLAYVSKKHKISYQNLLSWKKKGFLVRPE
jgi:hypothetical protein